MVRNGAYEVKRWAVEFMYCIHPHTMCAEEEDGRYPVKRFSCAGFVFEAYRSARITLLDVLEMPVVGLDKLKQSYPEHTQRLDDPAKRASMGLRGSGGWPVMMCGYLLHSLSRSKEDVRETPYAPRESDVNFS